jgi:hypothetical protein
MEYNLQKSITSSLNDLLLPPYGRQPLTSFPARDYVTPGIGQITSLYSFVVPLYSEISPYNIKKQVEIIQGDQIGSGTESSTIEPSTSLPMSSTVSPLMNDPKESVEVETKPNIEENERKRKLLGDGIEQSFLHPKVFKTKTVTLEQKSKVAVPRLVKPKPINHKFKFAD